MRNLLGRPNIRALARSRVFGTVLIGSLLTAVTACVPAGHEDILVPLKELNQDIAPVVVSCAEWHYPIGATVECRLESAEGQGTIRLKVERGAITPLDLPGAIEKMEPLP